MKKLIYLMFPFILLTACNRPLKLLEKGKDEKALKASMNRLKHGKVKQNHVYVLEKSFQKVTQSDAQKIQSWRRSEDPRIWKTILNEAEKIHQRQSKVNKVVHRLSKKGVATNINFYPAKSLIEEATDNVAKYHYDMAQQYIYKAREGQKSAARRAHQHLQDCQMYRADYLDALELEKEMYRLGTTHILLQPDVGDIQPRLADRLLNELLRNEEFPKRKHWQVVHFLPPPNEEMDYEAFLYFDDLRDYGEICDSDVCSNTKEIEVGTKKVQVWSATDSAYVEVEEPIFENISVTVTTYFQEKNTSIRLQCEIMDATTQEFVDRFYLCQRNDWSNEYSIVSGDRRALGLLCSDGGGCRSIPPSTHTMWSASARCMRRNVFREISRKVY